MSSTIHLVKLSLQHQKEEPKVDSAASAESANTPSQSSRQNSNQSRSEDDAVADAIAAATPALKN